MVDGYAVADYAAGALFLLVAIPIILTAWRSSVQWTLAAALVVRGAENIIQGIADAFSESAALFYVERALEYATVATFVLFAAVFSSAFKGRTGRRTVWIASMASVAFVAFAGIPELGFQFGASGGRTGAWRDAFDAFRYALQLAAALWVLDTAVQSDLKTVRRSGGVVAMGMAVYAAFEIGGDPLSALCNLESFTACSPNRTPVQRVQAWYEGIAAVAVYSAWLWAARTRGPRARSIGRWVIGLAAINFVRHLAVYLTAWEFPETMDNWFSRGLVMAQPVLLLYGMLRYQILGLDLKLKFTIKQSTLVAMFVGFFVAATQIAGAYLEDQSNSSVVGAVATLLLFGAISPLRKFAERVSTAAVPDAQGAAVIDDDGRLALYQEQLEFAWADGSIERQERVRLERLRERLNIAPADATRVERKLLGA